MRQLILVLVVMAVAASPLMAGEPGPSFDGDWWHDLPVQHDGRRKPLDTLGRETLRLLSNRSRITDPDTGTTLGPVAWYLTMLFEWQGWDHAKRDQLLLVADWRKQYFQLHTPDRWDEAPLLRVDDLDLRNLLGLRKDEAHISPLALSRALIEEPETGRPLTFPAWGEQLLRQEPQGTLNRLETRALELAGRLWSYQNHRMGRGLELVPMPGSDTEPWMSFGHLVLTHFDDANDPTGQCRQAQRLVRDAMVAYRQGDFAALQAAVDELKATLRDLGQERGDYPTPGSMRLEVAYNRWSPFRYAWAAMLSAAVAMLLHMGSRWRNLAVIAWVAFLGGMAAMLVGFTLRMAISGRPPVTNMYESIIYVGLGVAVFGLVFELIYRTRYILTAAAVVSSVALILADTFPTVLDPSVRPLEPVLRSNFWLVTHVMTITLSYAAFALALGIANITLGYFLVRSTNANAISALTRFTYKAIQVGVLLLAAGIILGGVWADYSWGRFWGWDPKEVWALVALLGYLCVLHARYAGWVGQRGLAALAVGCFALVVMAWYGVNFVLGAGLHSYGFGGGGQGWVYSAVALQLAYAGVALARSRPAQVGPRPWQALSHRVAPTEPVSVHSSTL